MSTTTTSLANDRRYRRELSPGASGSTPSEPAILQRERAVLREILRLVAERADAEAKVEAERTSQTTPRPTPSTQKTRRSPLIEKLRRTRKRGERGRREATTASDRRRGARGRGQGQGGIRRRQPQARHAVRQLRDIAKNDYRPGKAEAASAISNPARRKPPRSTPPRPSRSTTAPDGQIGIASAWLPSPRTTASSDSIPRPRPRPRVVRSVQRSRRRAFHAVGPDGAPAQAARELDHPQGDEGRPRSLGLHRDRDLVGGRPGRDGLGWASRSCIAGAAVAGVTLAFLLRTWLVKLSKSQLESRYMPLMQSLADADGLDRALPRPGRCRVQRGAQANRHPPRRRAEARRGELSQGVRRRRGPARREAAQDQRGLCEADG